MPSSRPALCAGLSMFERHLFAAALCVLAAAPARADVTAEQALARAKLLVAPAPCAASADGDEIVVCARRARDAYRVPAAEEGGVPGDVRGRAGEVPDASPERLAAGPCGIFAGERRCGRAEMELHGYYGGRDPISMLLKVGGALVDLE